MPLLSSPLTVVLPPSTVWQPGRSQVFARDTRGKKAQQVAETGEGLLAAECTHPFRRKEGGHRQALLKRQVVLQEVMEVKRPKGEKGQKAAVPALTPLTSWEPPPG